MQDAFGLEENHRRGGIKARLSMVVAAISLSLALTFGFGIGSSLVDSLNPVAAVAQDALGQQATAADVAEQANSAVVTITSIGAVSENSDQLVPFGTGSGFIIDEEGYVVTNSHVVRGASAFEVTFIDGETASATLVGQDAPQDVAVIKIDLEPGMTVPGVISFGDSDGVRAGDEVIAIGTPWGEYENSVTTGEVNGVERSLETGLGYQMPNLIQHDADIYPGNSGGPLVNMAGEVVGVNVAKAFSSMMGAQSMEGPGFAIASNDVSELVDEILFDGVADRAFLGIQPASIPWGVEVVAVVEDSAAFEAGLQVGDVLIGVEGVPGDSPTEALDTILFEREAGDTVTLEVLRNGEQTAIEVVLDERPAEEVE